MTDLLDRPSSPAGQDEACACGTGLSHRACCGVDWRTVDRRPTSPAITAQLAVLKQANVAQDGETVKEVAREILETAPGQRDAIAALYNQLVGAGEHGPATTLLDRLTFLNPNDANLRLIGAQYAQSRNDLARAQAHARMMVRLAPMALISHVTMGRAFLMQRNGQAAEHHFRRALELGRDRAVTPTPLTAQEEAEIEANLAAALVEQGRGGEARAIFSRLVETGGDTAALLMHWAAMEETARDFDASLALLDRAEAVRPGGPRIALQRASVHRRRKDFEAALAEIEGAGEGLEEGGDLLQRGHILDALGRYDEAFAAFDAFKAVQRERGQTYQAAPARQLVAGLTDFFSAGRAALLPRAELRTDTPQPIFIVGFPRSGTTLVEQTLTSHPDIAAGDELPLVNLVVDRAQVLLGSPGHYPLALSELWLGDRIGLIDTLRDFYLNEAARIGVVDPTKRWFTDKMPLNETHLGLIHLLFPQSPIIHLVRHPLDVVLSVFSNGLTHGFLCANALDTAATHYALIADLIRHYRAALPLRYHAVRYEELVEHQEREVRAMLDFIGAPFDPRTLDFHENRRVARTASVAQVTERLYTRSRYRYRNYRRHLEPVVPILQPAIEALGYRIED